LVIHSSNNKHTMTFGKTEILWINPSTIAACKVLASSIGGYPTLPVLGKTLAPTVLPAWSTIKSVYDSLPHVSEYFHGKNKSWVPESKAFGSMLWKKPMFGTTSKIGLFDKLKCWLGYKLMPTFAMKKGIDSRVVDYALKSVGLYEPMHKMGWDTTLKQMLGAKEGCWQKLLHRFGYGDRHYAKKIEDKFDYLTKGNFFSKVATGTLAGATGNIVYSALDNYNLMMTGDTYRYIITILRDGMVGATFGAFLSSLFAISPFIGALTTLGFLVAPTVSTVMYEGINKKFWRRIWMSVFGLSAASLIIFLNGGVLLASGAGALISYAVKNAF